MGRCLSLVLGLVLAAPAPRAPGEGPAEAAASAPIATRQTIFSIPFRIEDPEPGAPQPAEVRLYVSMDQGVTWRPYARVAPTDGQFLFRAVSDGEYWFLVRTLDKAGRLRPTGPFKPELRVVVDTTPPQLDLKAEAGEAGQVTARWQVTELAPKRESFRLQYREAPDLPWQPVTIDWDRVDVEGNTQSGSVTWVPHGGQDRVQIRAEVSDAAGNPAVSHAQVMPELNLAEARRKADALADRWRPAGRDPPDADPGSRPGDVAGSGAWQASTDYRDADPYRPYGQSRFEPHAGGLDERMATPSEEASRHLGEAPPRREYAPRGPREPTEPAAPDGMPLGTRPRMVNSRVFELEYDLGPARGPLARQVELFGTRNAGQTWESFGVDSDARSPMIVTAPDEGIYGFRVVASADPQMPVQAPSAGESPDVWVCVDLTRPTVRLISAERGRGSRSDQVIVRWEATDRRLGVRPVSIFYSQTAAPGSWTAIATDLANTGEHAWTAGPEVPERIYLRLEVRDEAGNVAVFETPRGVFLESGSDGGRVRDVRPINPAARRPRRYRFG